MTHQKKIDYIKGECIKANPAICLWEHGCHFKAYGEIFLLLKMETDKNSIHKLYYENVKTGKFHVTKYTTFIVEQFKIIGHTITLASIINTIVKNQEKTLVPYTLSVAYFVKKWNLTQDDLSQQENETIDYLYQILRNN